MAFEGVVPPVARASGGPLPVPSERLESWSVSKSLSELCRIGESRVRGELSSPTVTGGVDGCFGSQSDRATRTTRPSGLLDLLGNRGLRRDIVVHRT